MRPPASEHTTPRPVLLRRPILALIVLVLLLTAWRLLVIGTSGYLLTPDEAQYWMWSKQPALGYLSKPPLIAWLMHGLTGVCGDGEACLRSAAPLLHGVTALVVAAIARRVATPETAFWAGLFYATAPGVNLSAILMTTDALLLLFWALALYALVRLQDDGTQGRKTGWWLLLSVAIGGGLISKYAMGYFILSLGLWLILDRVGRKAILGSGRLWVPAVAALISLAIIAPNLLWNANNGFVTFVHTAGNADWRYVAFQPLAAIGRAFGFLASQFAVAGPITFGALCVICWRWRETWARPTTRFLLLFSVPVLGLMIVQALVSKAFANWAAAAHLAGCVMVALVLVEEGRRRLMILLVAANLLGALGLYHYDVLVRPIASAVLPKLVDPLITMRGWRDFGAEVSRRAKQHDNTVVVAGERYVFSLLRYYARPRPHAIVKWNPYLERRDDFDGKFEIPHHPARGPFMMVVTPYQAGVARTYFCKREKPVPLPQSRKTEIKRPLVTVLFRDFRGYDLKALKPCK